MTSVVQAAAAASILVGLVSVPAVSKTAVEPSMAQEMPEISENATSREVTRQVSSDGFTATVSTAFSELETTVSPGGADTVMKSPGSKLEVEKKPGSTVWTLTTSSGSLRLIQSSEKTQEVVETPSGTLKRTQKGSVVSTSFDGSDRSSVEEVREDLKDLLEQKRKELNDRRKKVAPSGSGATSQAELEIRLNESTASGFGNNTMEHVVVSNQAEKTVDLEGWTLENNNPQSADLGSYELESGESVRIYSSEVDADGITGTDITWENGGDTAKLFDSEGNKVAQDSY